MSKIILSIVFVLLVNISFAQRYTIKGRVVSELDSTNVIGAVVVCHPDSMVNVAFTDSIGYFEFSRVSKKTNKIMISCLGFKKIEIPISLKGTEIDLGFLRLPIDVYDMGRVSVRIPMMTQYGDTVQYNAAAFKMMEGATAFDLISSLPGIFVIDGKIKARGKEVFEVLLDGKKYYDGDAIKALKNIPVSVLDNIQLYDQQSDEERLTGYKDGQQKQVFNVRSKRPLDLKGWTNMSLLDGVNTNGEINNIYGFSGNGTVDTQQHRLTAEIQIANINNPTNGFAMMESFAFGGASIPIESARVMNLNKNHRIGLNYGYSKPKIKFDLRGNMGGVTDEHLSSSFDSYFPVDGIFSSRERISQSKNYMKSRNYDFGFDLEWTLHKNHTLRALLSFHNGERESRNSNLEDIIQNGDSISRVRSSEVGVANDAQLSADINYYFRMGVQRALTMRFLYRESPMNNETTPQNYVNEIYDETTMRWIPASVDNNYRRQFDRSRDVVSGIISYNQAIEKKHQVRVSLGSETTRNIDKQLLYGYNSLIGDYSSFFGDRSNDAKVKESSHSGNLSYSLVGVKDFRVNASIGVKYAEQEVLNYLNPQYNVRNDDVMLNSNVQALYHISQSDNLNFNFRSNGEMPMAQYLSPIIQDNNASNILIGNPNLKGSNTYNASIGYNSSKKSTFSARIGADWNTNAIVRLLEFMPTDRDTLIYAVNSPADTAGKGYIPQRGATVMRMENRSGTFRFNVGVDYGVRINPISSTLSVTLGYDYSKMSLYDGSDDFTKTHTQKLGLFFTSNITKSLEFKLRYQVDYSIKFVPYGSRITKLSQGASGELIYQFFKRMRLSTLCSWTHINQYGSSIPSNSMVNVDAGLGVYLDQRRNFLLSVNGENLLDNTSGIYDYLYDTYSSRRINDGFGRYVTLQLSYKFNSMQRMPKLKKGEKTNSGKFFDN